MKPMDNAERKKLVKQIFNASLESVDSYKSVKKYADSIFNIIYQERKYKSLYLIGFGKAACPMTKAIEDSFLNLIDAGILITKYKHCNPPYKPKKILVHEAGHPVPDENGLRGTNEIIDILKKADKNTLVICLISGGGSTLLVSPYDGVTLDEKKKITQLLLKAGADINELNTVRKHLSKVKGGRLAEIAYPAKVISLILSDVIGDRLDVIASGPTSPDKTTYMNALSVLKKHDLLDKTPESILKVLYSGIKGEIPETPKEGDKIFEGVENIIIGSNRKALKAAKTKAESLGFETEIISSEIIGEAREAGKWLAKKALAVKSEASGVKRERKCFISGGETTVIVKGNGIGGRNMELALSFAMEIEGIDGITLLSAGTDGTDGPTDAAGAIVDEETIKKAKMSGLDPEEYLNNNNSYNFFKKIDGLFITGSTGTNVMDMQIVIVESQ
jgi:hydroxypyruvate reductase/glycerate 2-kinase